MDLKAYQGLSILKNFLLKVGFIALLEFSMALANSPNIRVKLASKRSELVISGVDLVKKTNSKRETFYRGKKTLTFNCRPLKKLFRNITHSHKDKKYNAPSYLALAKIHSKTGLLEFDEKKYRGEIFLASSSKGGCDVIHKLDLESYLNTLLPKEMNAKWPIEALKAQAVAARSYAVYQMNKHRSKQKKSYYDIENSEKHQVNGTYFATTLKTAMATRATYGEILVPESSYDRGGKIVPIFFHSKCGGRTRLPEEVWSHPVSDYQSVKCPYCHKHGMENWKLKVSRKKLGLALKKVLKKYSGQSQTARASKFSIAPDEDFRANLRVYSPQGLHLIKKSRIRSVLGRSKAPSNYFKVERTNKDFLYLKGQGFGHGVGMCQYGALEMAKQGLNYKRILSHYFPKMRLKKIY